MKNVLSGWCASRLDSKVPVAYHYDFEVVLGPGLKAGWLSFEAKLVIIHTWLPN